MRLLEKELKRKLPLTATKKNAGILLRHLQKRSLPRKKFIFSLQMSNKHLALLLAIR